MKQKIDKQFKDHVNDVNDLLGFDQSQLSIFNMDNESDCEKLSDNNYPDLEFFKANELLNYYVKYNNTTTIMGPWFLACDHGCYHGDNCHGLGVLNVWGCPEANGNNYSEDEVYKICTKQIDHSNIIFAYIYDNTCYGSIYEIAYAKAKGKKVIIIFDTEERMQDMWFMCQGADYVDVLRDESIRHKFNEIMSYVNIVNK